MTKHPQNLPNVETHPDTQAVDSYQDDRDKKKEDSSVNSLWNMPNCDVSSDGCDNGSSCYRIRKPRRG